MKLSKKIIALFLACLMAFTVIAIPASASADQPDLDYPILSVRGKASGLYAADGETSIYPSSVEMSELPKQIASDIAPALIKALQTGKMDPFYEVVDKELLRFFGEAQLSPDGEVTDGSGLDATDTRWNTTNFQYPHGSDHHDDGFGYSPLLQDWRRDPFYTADLIEEKIDMLCETYGTDKVDIWVVCFGSNALLAYLQKYGSSKIRSILWDSCMMQGSDLISDFFSGDIQFDGDAIKRFCLDFDDWNTQGREDVDETLIMLIKTLGELVGTLEDKGVITTANDLYNKLYDKIGDDIFPHIIMSTLGTFPNFWASVRPDKYQKARDLVFKTDEQKQKYAGLLEKTDRYQNDVAKHAFDLVQDAMDNGVECGAICKYGVNEKPIVKDADALSDGTSSVRTASFGSTYSTITTRLSPSYVQSQFDKGLSKYISADKQIDASTSMLKDKIWFIKDLVHEDYEDYDDLLKAFFASKGTLTVDSNPDLPQFRIAVGTHTNKYGEEAATLVKMDITNCDNGHDYVTSEEVPKTRESFIVRIFRTIKQAFITLFSFIKKLFTPQNPEG